MFDVKLWGGGHGSAESPRPILIMGVGIFQCFGDRDLKIFRIWQPCPVPWLYTFLVLSAECLEFFIRKRCCVLLLLIECVARCWANLGNSWLKPPATGPSGHAGLCILDTPVDSSCSKRHSRWCNWISHEILDAFIIVSVFFLRYVVALCCSLRCLICFQFLCCILLCSLPLCWCLCQLVELDCPSRALDQVYPCMLGRENGKHVINNVKCYGKDNGGEGWKRERERVRMTSARDRAWKGASNRNIKWVDICISVGNTFCPLVFCFLVGFSDWGGF